MDINKAFDLIKDKVDIVAAGRGEAVAQYYFGCGHICNRSLRGTIYKKNRREVDCKSI